MNVGIIWISYPCTKIRMIKARETTCGSDDGDNCDTYTPIVIEKGRQAATSIGILKTNKMVFVYHVNKYPCTKAIIIIILQKY